MTGPWVCSGCGKRFGGLHAFDHHRVGRTRDVHPHYGRVCRNAYHLALMGYVLKDGVWRKPIPEEKKWWRTT